MITVYVLGPCEKQMSKVVLTRVEHWQQAYSDVFFLKWLNRFVLLTVTWQIVNITLLWEIFWLCKSNPLQHILFVTVSSSSILLESVCGRPGGPVVQCMFSSCLCGFSHAPIVQTHATWVPLLHVSVNISLSLYVSKHKRVCVRALVQLSLWGPVWVCNLRSEDILEKWGPFGRSSLCDPL